MTKLHRIYFTIWKAYMFILGIKAGVFVSEYSDSKKKNIKGVITSLSGESITRNKYGFDINIHWLEPINGNDSRYYSYGSYSFNDFKTKLTRV